MEKLGWRGLRRRVDAGWRHLSPDPGDRDATKRSIGQDVESRGAEIQGGLSAPCATIGDCYCDALASIASCYLPVADRVIIRVAIAAGVAIEEEFRDGTNVVSVNIGDTACTKTGSIECTITLLGTGEVVFSRGGSCSSRSGGLDSGGGNVYRGGVSGRGNIS